MLGQADLLSQFIVILAVHDRGMHDAGAVGRRHEISRIHFIRCRLLKRRDFEERLVFDFRPSQLGAGEFSGVVARRKTKRFEAIDGGYEIFSIVLHGAISDIRSDGKRDISGEGPGRRGPGEDIDFIVRLYRVISNFLPGF